MRRREFLATGLAFVAQAGGCSPAPDGARTGGFTLYTSVGNSVPQGPPVPLPDFEIVEVGAGEAFATWQGLAGAGGTYPVILGDAEEARSVLDLARSTLLAVPQRAQILEEAGALNFPADLQRYNEEEERKSRALTEALLAEHPDALPQVIDTGPDGLQRVLPAAEARALLLGPAVEPPLGDWPTVPEAMTGWSGSYRSSGPRPPVWIAKLPVADWTEVPALLRWGGWNACPPPAFHVAAFRHWRAQYGAELVTLSPDAVDLRVARRPADRAAALALAREFHLYCPDLIFQGFGTLNALAASLMASDWWNFWWD